MERLRKQYFLNGYSVVPDEQLLSHGGKAIHLPKRPFHVLLYLIENRERFVSRAELLDHFWDGKDVYDDALRKCIGAIRKALDEPPDRPRFIETRWGVGYRYIGPLQEQIVPFETATTTEVEKTRGVRIVVEEEEIQDDLVGKTIEVKPARLASAQSKRKAFLRIGIPAIILLSVMAGAAALIISRRSDGNRPATRHIHSVAVLPLRNLTGNPANDYLSDGVTESLITALSRVQDLKVVARGSAFTLKNHDLDPQEAGRLLNVAALLEGSLSQSGNQLHVNVRLVSTNDGEVLWASNTSDRPLTDIFVIQDEIAGNVVTGLRIKLGKESSPAPKRYTTNVEAYQTYLRGRYFLNKRTTDGIMQAIDCFQRAIQIDPNYSLAYAGLAEGYDKSYYFIELPPQEVIAKERAAATRALQLDDSLAEAHVAMATVYANIWDLGDAAKEEERAIEIDPLNVDAHHNYAYRLIDLLRPDEAVAEIRRAQELDPLNVVMNVDVGEILFYARRHDEAITALQHALEMDPNRANAHFDLARIYEEKGMYAEAVAEHSKDYRLNGESSQTIATLEEAFRTGGIKAYWRTRIAQIKAKGGYVEPVVLADLYTLLGDKDNAFAQIEKAYQARSPFLVGIKSSFRFDVLRSDPRYDDLVRRVGL
jgi:TolB-like protein/DNA-binding winged helix-turn-helix (wHTH) protein/Tfp pilus assembly protein PilF